KYREAETLAQQALAVHRSVGEARQLDVAWDLDLIGSTYLEQSKFREAEQSYKEALAIRERTKGKPNLANSLTRLRSGDRRRGITLDFVALDEPGIAARSKSFADPFGGAPFVPSPGSVPP